MRNCKSIIMLECTSKFTILRHFLKIFCMLHMPPKPIASAGCDTTLLLCKKNIISNKNIHPNSSILFYFFKIFSSKYICPLHP